MDREKVAVTVPKHVFFFLKRKGEDVIPLQARCGPEVG